MPVIDRTEVIRNNLWQQINLTWYNVVWNVVFLLVYTRDGMSWYIRLGYEMNLFCAKFLVAEEEERQCENE